jgi:hypothetical protein
MNARCIFVTAASLVFTACTGSQAALSQPQAPEQYVSASRGVGAARGPVYWTPDHIKFPWNGSASATVHFSARGTQFSVGSPLGCGSSEGALDYAPTYIGKTSEIWQFSWYSEYNLPESAVCYLDATQYIGLYEYTGQLVIKITAK